MPFLPRLRLDIALGLLIAGTIWYIGTRPRTRPRPGDHVQLTDEDDTPIVEGALEALKPLLYEPALLERIMVLSDPRTMIRVAQVSKYHQEHITSSPSIQLLLRNYYHQLPPVTNPSPVQRTYLTRQPKKRQLDDLLDREERLSRVKHTKIQRCAVPYIDVLCSGDYTIVTKCLSGRYRQEGNVESGQVEDGYTVMVPRDSVDKVEDEEEVEGGNPRRKDRLEGYTQRTVDVGEEIADIGVRADEDLIIIATVVPEDQVTAYVPKPKVVRLSFYHLETYTPISSSSEMANPIPHSGARHQVAEFAFTTAFTSIRLRAGPDGKLLIWAKNDFDKSDTTALIYDWKLGQSIGYAWPSGKGMREGIPHDFTFFTPEILILAVLKRVEPGLDGYTPTDRLDATKLEIQTWRLPNPELYSESHKRFTTLNKDQAEPNGFDMIPLSSCRLCSTYKFPSFTHKWVNPTPMDDEVPAEDGQTFTLFHCSVAAKPAPVSYTTDKDSRQGILCITIEGDFGPFTHPNGPPHDHGSIAFCTVSGSTFSTAIDNSKRPKVYEYEEWNKGNVSWEFGPMNTWVTGFGTRTALVTRYVGISQLMSEDPDFEDAPQRSLVMNVTMRNYDPIAVKKQGRITRHPLGRPRISADESTPFTPTGVPDPDTEPAPIPMISDAEGLDALFDTINDLPLNINILPPNVPPPPPGMFAATPLHQLSDLIRSMNVAQGGNAFKVIKYVDHGFRPEMFGEFNVRSTMPYYEASVAIPIPMPETEEGREDPAMEHPFKTILARDRLIVCDDAGFDLVSI